MRLRTRTETVVAVSTREEGTATNLRRPFSSVKPWSLVAAEGRRGVPWRPGRRTDDPNPPCHGFFAGVASGLQEGCGAGEAESCGTGGAARDEPGRVHDGRGLHVGQDVRRARRLDPGLGEWAARQA